MRLDGKNRPSTEDCVLTSTSVETAGQIILLCKDMKDSGYILQKSWIAR
jgi:hypothetical protein